MKKESSGKTITMCVLLIVLCYLYFDDKLNYKYMSMAGEMIIELLKHVVIELIEHLKF